MQRQISHFADCECSDTYMLVQHPSHILVTLYSQNLPEDVAAGDEGCAEGGAVRVHSVQGSVPSAGCRETPRDACDGRAGRRTRTTTTGTQSSKTSKSTGEESPQKLRATWTFLHGKSVPSVSTVLGLSSAASTLYFVVHTHNVRRKTMEDVLFFVCVQKTTATCTPKPRGPVQLTPSFTVSTHTVLHHREQNPSTTQLACFRLCTKNTQCE